jgi:hypothetical protein
VVVPRSRSQVRPPHWADKVHSTQGAGLSGLDDDTTRPHHTRTSPGPPRPYLALHSQLKIQPRACPPPPAYPPPTRCPLLLWLAC